MARRPALRVDLDAEHDRYHRQSLIAWWDQDRLREARVVVVGAGALGNELVKNLALLGVGTILVVDLDRVENSNLSRCVFFRSEDEGRETSGLLSDSVSSATRTSSSADSTTARRGCSSTRRAGRPRRRGWTGR
jgi:molybdopterin/thiamine biosynthesis adenylyltransferase